MRQLAAFLLLLWFAAVRAFGQPPAQSMPTPSQAAPASPALQLSPDAAYDQAVRPLDIVRRAAQNWSDSELAALDVATGQAKTACLARTPGEFTGEDLLAYARLCAFAQQWLPVKQAATNYLIAQNAASPADKVTGFPNLSLAFDYEVQASLHLKDSANAFGTAQTMLRTVPYDDLASDAVNATVRYVQLVHTDEAIALLAQRQPLLLALLKTPEAPPASGTQSAHPPMSIHALYADAIALPAMLQFANQDKAAAAVFAELEMVLPANLSPDDAILTAASRRQYRLLGSRLPEIFASAWLLDTDLAVPHDLNRRFGEASIFLLFPDWCAQCVALSPQLKSAASQFNQSGVYFYALLAQADPKPPAVKPPPRLAVKASSSIKAGRAAADASAKAGVPHVDLQMSVKPVPAELLMGTPTLIVPSETLDAFVATDFPLLIATDHDGIIRYIQLAPDNALVPGGLAEQIADRILSEWPPATR